MSKQMRYPVSGTFELTGRCNLQCKMCLVRVDQKRINELGFKERTADEWIDMARQIFEAGTLELLLTGGEVMLRPDFAKIYEAIAQMGFLLTVYTNATMVTDEIYQLFQKYPPHKIGVTMYGASNKTYEELCGMKDGYDRFVSGFENLKTLPSLLDIRTTLVKTNCDDLEKMWEFTEKHFGDRSRLHISRFVCKEVRGGICHPAEIRLSPEENIRVTQGWLFQLHDEMLNDPAKKLIFKDSPLTILDAYSPQKSCKDRMIENADSLFENCKAGIDQFAISWAGHMYACELMDKFYTEPFKDGFVKAWETLPEKYPKPQHIEECDGCKYQMFCETCPANRLAETGSFFKAPEYACQEAKVKYELFNQDS